MSLLYNFCIYRICNYSYAFFEQYATSKKCALHEFISFCLVSSKCVFLSSRSLEKKKKAMLACSIVNVNFSELVRKTDKPVDAEAVFLLSCSKHYDTKRTT